jgi:asparagine synthase (glutamine-hydrolysing)
MCGIAGHLAFPSADPGIVQTMIATLSHRGPDGVGSYHRGPIALGHTRLAIIDLHTGEQPKFNEDGRVAVVFNGEIYNYRELRTELASRHRFTSESDTEVLVHLYEEFGDEMVSKLDGMFSFAIWDARRERLLAARDRFGEKPFLYLFGERGLFFASELAAFGAAGLCGQIDRSALSSYLTLLYVPAPRTIWKDINKLPAGHTLVVDRNGALVAPYWRSPRPGSRSETTLSAERAQSELRRSVRTRLRSDVPMGALLSGGIDSSTVVALMAQELGPGVKTFSVGFGRPDDELPFARTIASRYETDHHEIVLERDLAAQVDDAFQAYSEPMGDSSAVPTVAIFKEISRHVKVVLTGDGGDELFGGYGRYGLAERLPTLPTMPTRWLSHLGLRRHAARRGYRLMHALTTSGAARNLALIEVFNAGERASLLGTAAEEHSQSNGAAKGNANAAIGFDLTVYLPDDLLVKVDIASMASGVESRAPFLDHVLAECVVPEPSHSKLNRREGKLLLKEAVASLVPKTILERSKRGFGSPVKEWLAGPLRGLLLDTVGSSQALVCDWFDRGAVSRTVRDAAAGQGNAHQGWALLALEAWAQRFARSLDATGRSAAGADIQVGQAF